MSTSFRLDRSWVFSVVPGELWQALSRTDDFPAWWSWLKVFDSGGLVEHTTSHCVVRAPVPYALSFDVTILAVVPERLVDTRVSGDLEGPARLEVAPHPVGSEARLVWDVRPHSPLLRAAAQVGRPLLEWGQDWVVDTGVRQFRLAGLGHATG